MFSFGRTLALMCQQYTVEGCHLYRSILSMMLTMFQSLQSFPLHHFLNPKLKFLHAAESLSPSLILLAICVFVHATFSDFLPYKTQFYEVSSCMNFQRRCLVRIIQLLLFNVVVILFQPLRLLPFTFSSSLFLTHFNLSKVIKMVLLHKLLRDNTVPRKFSFCLSSPGFKLFWWNILPFELGAENHQVHDHR